MTDVKRPTQFRSNLYERKQPEPPVTPDQAREDLGWRLLPENKQYSHDD
jgi:hypothetical protein